MHSPLDHQVIQRSSKTKGSMLISGELAGFTAKKWSVEARLIVDGQPGKWRRLSVNPSQHTFEAKWDVRLRAPDALLEFVQSLCAIEGVQHAEIEEAAT